MQKNISSQKRSNLIWFIAIGIAAFALFYCFTKRCDSVFLTNDDVHLRGIASGEVSGIPDAHMYYVGYLSGLLVSSFYRCFPAVNWYGIYLMVSFAAGVGLSIYGCILSCKKNIERFLAAAILIFCSYAFLFLHVAEIQFTTVTAMVGSAALVFFSRGKTSPEKGCKGYLETLCSYLPFILLSIWAVSIRDKAWLMLLPFVICLGIFKLQKEKNIHLVSVGITYAILLAGVLLIDAFSYRSKEWTEFKQYTDATEILYDYTGFPSFADNKELYESNNISETVYEAAYLHSEVILHPEVNASSMESLASFAKEDSKRMSVKIAEMPTAFIRRHMDYTDRPLNLIVYFLYAVVLLEVIVGKDKENGKYLLAIFVARMIVWIYLLYNGRYPARVTQGIYIAEFELLLFEVTRLWNEGSKKSESKGPVNIQNGLWILCAVSVVALSVRFGLSKVEKGVGEAYARMVMSESYEDINQYMLSHEENIYLLDQKSVGSFTESVLHKKPEHVADSNFVLLGSWLPHSPWYETRLKAWGLDSEHLSKQVLDEDNHIYFVFMDTEVTSADYLEKFYQETYNASLSLVDTVDTRGNIRFFIYEARQ